MVEDHETIEDMFGWFGERIFQTKEGWLFLGEEIDAYGNSAVAPEVLRLAENESIDVRGPVVGICLVEEYEKTTGHKIAKRDSSGRYVVDYLGELTLFFDTEEEIAAFGAFVTDRVTRPRKARFVKAIKRQETA